MRLRLSRPPLAPPGLSLKDAAAFFTLGSNRGPVKERRGRIFPAHLGPNRGSVKDTAVSRTSSGRHAGSPDSHPAQTTPTSRNTGNARPCLDGMCARRVWGTGHLGKGRGQVAGDLLFRCVFGENRAPCFISRLFVAWSLEPCRGCTIFHRLETILKFYTAVQGNFGVCASHRWICDGFFWGPAHEVYDVVIFCGHGFPSR
jgi:hypothetical protein